MLTIELSRLDEILEKANDLTVAVVGDLMLDIYLSGAVDRISPEAPVPVVHVSSERSALGGAANVAANVLQLGANCEVIGFVGADNAGDQLRRALASLEGGTVLPLLVSDGDRPTTTKTRVMARNQQVVRFDRERSDDLDASVVATLCDLIRDSLGRADVLVLEDYNKGVLSPTVIRCAIGFARRAAIPIVVDPKFRNIFEYAGATVVKPNALELTSAMGVPIRPHDDEWLNGARTRLGCEHLLVTMGEEGMVAYSEDGNTVRVPAIAREVFDVSGAGDTVTAFLAIALGVGASLPEAMILANYAAAVEVGKPGVATVSPQEIREVVSRHQAEIFT